jgi:hypothetical protein
VFLRLIYSIYHNNQVHIISYIVLREAGTREDCTREVGTREDGRREVGTREVGMSENGKREVGTLVPKNVGATCSTLICS